MSRTCSFCGGWHEDGLRRKAEDIQFINEDEEDFVEIYFHKRTDKKAGSNANYSHDYCSWKATSKARKNWARHMK